VRRRTLAPPIDLDFFFLPLLKSPLPQTHHHQSTNTTPSSIDVCLREVPALRLHPTRYHPNIPCRGKPAHSHPARPHHTAAKPAPAFDCGGDGGEDGVQPSRHSSYTRLYWVVYMRLNISAVARLDGLHHSLHWAHVMASMRGSKQPNSAQRDALCTQSDSHPTQSQSSSKHSTIFSVVFRDG
jgi:hypothetical protein